MKQPETLSIPVTQLMDLIHAARRYADRRSTYAPSEFNRMYESLIAAHPIIAELDCNIDETLTDHGKYFPHAQDGDYCPTTGFFDARPRRITNRI